jgi:hypothetical protein
MGQAAKSRKSLNKVKSEELRLSCKDRSREVFEPQTVECRTRLGAKSETDTLAASMNDSEVLIASSEDPASRIILVDNIPFSVVGGAQGVLIRRFLQKHGHIKR